MAISNYIIDITLRARGAQQSIANVDKSLKQLDASAAKVGRRLERLFHAGIGALVVTELLGMIDTYTTLNNRIAVVTKTQEEANAVLEEVFNVANRARVPVEAVANTYSRIRQATETMGLSQAKALRMTETLAKGLLVNGATASEAASTMRQFTQALSKGKLNGDEFVSVMENSPAIVKLLTEEMKVSKGELFALAKAGKIGARTLVEALGGGAEEIDRQFAKMTPTIGQALTVLRNNMVKFVGELATSSGLAKGLSRAIIFLAENFDTFAKFVLSASYALGVVFAAKAVRAAIQGMRALAIAALANPFTAMAAAVVFIVGLLYQFDAGIRAVGLGTISFQRVVEVAWRKIWATIKEVVSALGRLVVEAFDYIYEGFKELEIGFGDVLVFVGIFVDKFIALMRFLKDTVVFIVAGIAAAFVYVLAKGLGEALSLLEDGINKAIDSYNYLAGKISGKLTLGKLDLGGDFLLRVADAADKTGQHFADKVGESFKALTSTELGPVASAIRGVLEEAARGGDRAAKSLFDLNQIGKDTFKGIPEKAKKSKDEFEKFVESIYPAIKALNDLKDAKRIVDAELSKGAGTPLLSADQAQAKVRELTRLMKQGKISAEQYANALQEVADMSKRRASSRINDEQGNQLLDRQRYILLETADPLGHYNYLVGQAANQALLLQTAQDALPSQFQAEIKAREKLNKLIEDGIVLSDFEIAARKERGVDTTEAEKFRDSQLETLRIAALVDAQAEETSQKAIDRNKRLADRLQASRDPSIEYTEMLQEIADQYAAVGEGAFNFAEAVAELDKQFGLTRDPIPSEDAEKWNRLNEELNEMVSTATLVQTAFASMNDQIVAMVLNFDTAELSFTEFVNSMLESLTRLILKVIETRILMALLGDPGGTTLVGAGNLLGPFGGKLMQPAGFAEGGHFTVRGKAGRDNNLAVMRLSNDEDVRIRTPEQRRRDEKQEGTGAPPQVVFQAVNQVDPGQMVPVIGSRAGRRQVFNSIRYAPRAVERLR